jgi:hypothetical protein
VNNEEIQAYISVGASLVGTVKENNAALRATKRALLAAMEAIGTDAIDSDSRPGVGIVIAPPRVTLDLTELNDATIVYLARKGALRTSRTAWAILNEDERASLAAVATFAAPSAEFYFYTNKKGEALAPSMVQKPPISVAELRLGRAGAIAAGEEAASWQCPTHPAREPQESKYGGVYCTAKNPETKSGFCTLSSNKKAS